jgi:hypothetical protein
VPPPTWIHIRPTRTKRLIKLTRYTQAQWRKHWKPSKSGTQLRTTFPAPSAKTLALYKEVSRPLSSIITGLCTEYLGLNEALHKIQASEIDSPVCNLCHSNDNQTVHHILFTCQSLSNERNVIWREIGETLTSTRKLLAKPAHAKHAALLILKSRVLSQFRYVDAIREEQALEPPDDGEPEGHAA